MLHRPASVSTSSQPKSIAVAGDGSVFVVEINSIEVIRSNQKVSELKPKYNPVAVAATKSTIAVGGEVSLWLFLGFLDVFFPVC
jgi:WD repeat-containing protein 1 (actin-interacting protein 1)